MKLTNKGRGLVAGILVAAIATTSWAFNHETKAEAGDCTVMQASQVNGSQWQALKDNGWQNGGTEDLWSPECSKEAIQRNEAKMAAPIKWTCPEGWEYVAETFTCEVSWTN
jgi:hypothetical protein